MDRPLSVSEVSLLIKNTLEGDPFLSRLYIIGEVSSFRLYPSGHCYFSLKDGQSLISCVMWASEARSLRYFPKEGDLIEARGRIGVYPARGSYQFVANSLHLAGQGEELLRLERLKAKLQAEGLFDPSRKKPLPRFPKSIAIIAGSGSAGMVDIVHNINLRWPLVNLLQIPSLVQGEGAPQALIEALKKAIALKPDLIILGRGGGAKEDLSAFNDEQLVRFASSLPIPFISCVGHEIDTTLIDFVSDKRVSTPTAAAIAAVPDKEEIYAFLDDSSYRLKKALESSLRGFKQKLEYLSLRPFFASPEAIYRDKEEKVSQLGDRLKLGFAHHLETLNAQRQRLGEKLETLNPKGVLGRGYSITYDENGKAVTALSQVKIGSRIKTELSGGIMESEVIAKEEK